MIAVCQLCGVRGDVAVDLVRWANPPADAAADWSRLINLTDSAGVVQSFASLTRCRDRAGCRRRHGGDWPVVDGDVSGTPDADKVRATLAAERLS